MIPVRPPIISTKKKPRTNNTGVRMCTRPIHSVAIQQKIWSAVGIAIMKLIAVKKLLPSSGTLVANMWCTHSPNDRKPVAMSESTMASCPNIGLRANVGMIAEMNPRPGRKMK